jgi:hypothetical protein
MALARYQSWRAFDLLCGQIASLDPLWSHLPKAAAVVRRIVLVDVMLAKHQRRGEQVSIALIATCNALPTFFRWPDRRIVLEASHLIDRGRGTGVPGRAVRGNERRPPLSDSLRRRVETVSGLPSGEGAGRDMLRAGR